jgi:hypothetical protein
MLNSGIDLLALIAMPAMPLDFKRVQPDSVFSPEPMSYNKS